MATPSAETPKPRGRKSPRTDEDDVLRLNRKCQLEKPRKKQIGVDVDEAIHTRLRKLAFKGTEEGREFTTISEIVNAALLAFLPRLEREWDDDEIAA